MTANVEICVPFFKLGSKVDTTHDFSLRVVKVGATFIFLLICFSATCELGVPSMPWLNARYTFPLSSFASFFLPSLSSFLSSSFNSSFNIYIHLFVYLFIYLLLLNVFVLRSFPVWFFVLFIYVFI